MATQLRARRGGAIGMFAAALFFVGLLVGKE